MNEINEMPSREKSWEERGDTEKIELLADRLVYLQRIVNGIAATVERLETHVHVADRLYFGDGPKTHLQWPNQNILNRESRDLRRLEGSDW